MRDGTFERGYLLFLREWCLSTRYNDCNDIMKMNRQINYFLKIFHLRFYKTSSLEKAFYLDIVLQHVYF